MSPEELLRLLMGQPAQTATLPVNPNAGDQGPIQPGPSMVGRRDFRGGQAELAPGVDELVRRPAVDPGAAVSETRRHVPMRFDRKQPEGPRDPGHDILDRLRFLLGL